MSFKETLFRLKKFDPDNSAVRKAILQLKPSTRREENGTSVAQSAFNYIYIYAHDKEEPETGVYVTRVRGIPHTVFENPASDSILKFSAGLSKARFYNFRARIRKSPQA